MGCWGGHRDLSLDWREQTLAKCLRSTLPTTVIGFDHVVLIGLRAFENACRKMDKSRPDRPCRACRQASVRTLDRRHSRDALA